MITTHFSLKSKLTELYVFAMVCGGHLEAVNEL